MMTSNDDSSIDRANEEGLNADASTQSNLWNEDEERQEDGFRRDEFGNPDGRKVNASGDAVNQDGQRVGDDGQPLDEDNDSEPGVLGVVPPIPPMMGH